MVKWYYRSVFDELEDIRKYMELLNRQMYGTSPPALLPASGESAIKMLPAQRTTIHVHVSEKDDEVIVTTDMIFGITKDDIALHLINPRALEITCERMDEKKDDNEGYYMRERNYGSISRVITLPKAVTEHGAIATFMNGVLEVHLKKVTKGSGGKISID